jgi:hypothetical protein
MDCGDAGGDLKATSLKAEKLSINPIFVHMIPGGAVSDIAVGVAGLRLEAKTNPHAVSFG